MSQGNYSQWIAASFMHDPDCYNSSVLVLLKRQRAKLPVEEFQAVVRDVQNHLVEKELKGEFFHLLLENEIVECLSGLKRLNLAKVTYCLQLMELENYPKEVDGQPTYCQDFWHWFEALPKIIQQTVWDIAGEMPYG